MLCWGSNTYKLIPVDFHQITRPVECTYFNNHKIGNVATSDSLCVVVTKDGMVYKSGREEHELGTGQDSNHPVSVDIFSTLSVQSVACGKDYSIVLTQAGQLYGWGRNDHGQLGVVNSSANSLITKPKQIKQVGNVSDKVIQVKGGHYHVLAMLQDGTLYAWGLNSSGQLGLGNLSDKEPVPKLVSHLKGLPVAMVTAGGNHSFVLSHSGAIYGWGNNSHGQVGVGSSVSVLPVPQLLETLRSLVPSFISCGDNHTAILTQDGGVFTCGEGSKGQLGHGSLGSISTPRKVAELMGTVVSQIACGSSHTLILEQTSGKVCSFGSATQGQLGGESLENQATPTRIKGVEWSPSYGSPVDSNTVVVQKLFASGNNSFVIKVTDMNDEVSDHRCFKGVSLPFHITSEGVKSIWETVSKATTIEKFKRYCELVFQSLSNFNASFLSSTHHLTNERNPGISSEAVTCFSKVLLAVISEKDLEQKMCTWFSQLLSKVSVQLVDIECMRVYWSSSVLMISLPYQKRLSLVLQPLTTFSKSIIQQDKAMLKVFGHWLVNNEKEHFKALVAMCVHTLNSVIKELYNLKKKDVKVEKWRIDPKSARFDVLYSALTNILLLTDKLKEWNTDEAGSDRVIPYRSFYLSSIQDRVNFIEDYIIWKNKEAGKLTYCHHPHTLDAACKATLMEVESVITMEAFNHTERIGPGLIPPNITPGPYLHIHVSREHILHDSMIALKDLHRIELKKRLRVSFIGEEGDDEGGLRKEFFMLVIQELMNPQYGLFVEDEESHMIWFSDSLAHLNSKDDNMNYFLAGLICGLAIYNYVAIDLPFPSALYKMLIGRHMVYQDLAELKPSLASGFQAVLDYNGDDIQRDLDLTFEICKHAFGQSVKHCLVPNGDKIPVTMENRGDYVSAYLKYTLYDCVEASFESFKDGFLKVYDSHLLTLCHHEELKAMVIGERFIDFKALEEITEYRNGYSKYHPVIEAFWKTLHEFPQEAKRKFLAFLTGSDRISIGGMKYLNVVIQRTHGGEGCQNLPVAHTCFIVLDLPPYPNGIMMKEKLLQAIYFTQGFGLL